MNTRLLHGWLVFLIVCTGVLGCANKMNRNPALSSGGPSSLTVATHEAIDNADPNRAGVLGGLQPGKKSSAGERLLAPFKSMGDSLKPQSLPDSAQDPLSLNNKSGPPSPDLFLSAARVIATGGNLENAKSLYEQALIANPNDRDALLELARIEVQMEDFAAATDRYMTAVEAHPDDPIVFNDLGLFHRRRENWELAIKAFQRAIEIDPKRKLYRNNLADLWVQVDRTDLALEQLNAVHPVPVAHYNLGYLLYSHEKMVAAIEHFERAYQADNQFIDAVLMRDQLLEQVQRAQRNSEPRRMVRPASFQQDEAGEKQTERASTVQATSEPATTVPATTVPATTGSAELATTDNEPSRRDGDVGHGGDVEPTSTMDLATSRGELPRDEKRPQRSSHEREAPSIREGVAAGANNDEAKRPPGPRIIVLSDSDSPQPSVSTRLSDLADTAVDEAPESETPAPTTASPQTTESSTPQRPAVLSPQLAAQPIPPRASEPVHQAQPIATEAPGGSSQHSPRPVGLEGSSDQEQEADDVFVKYERFWMPIGFYSAIEQADQGAVSLIPAEGQPSERAKRETNLAAPGSPAQPPAPRLLDPNGFRQARVLGATAPQTSDSHATQSETNSATAHFEKRAAPPVYYPTTGAPPVTPRRE